MRPEIIMVVSDVGASHFFSASSCCASFRMKGSGTCMPTCAIMLNKVIKLRKHAKQSDHAHGGIYSQEPMSVRHIRSYVNWQNKSKRLSHLSMHRVDHLPRWHYRVQCPPQPSNQRSPPSRIMFHIKAAAAFEQATITLSLCAPRLLSLYFWHCYQLYSYSASI